MFILCWPSIADRQLGLPVGDVCFTMGLFWESYFFFIWMWFSTGNSFWVRSEGMIPLLSFLGPHLVQSCKLYEWCHSLCEFICSSALLCLEGLDSFQFSTHIWFLQLFLFHRTPWTRGRDLIEASSVSWCSKFSHCLTLARLWVFVFFSHQLENELLWWWLSMTLIWVKQNAIIYWYNLILYC